MADSGAISDGFSTLLGGTSYEGYRRFAAGGSGDPHQLADVHNLVILIRFPIVTARAAAQARGTTPLSANDSPSAGRGGQLRNPMESKFTEATARALDHRLGSHMIGTVATINPFCLGDVDR
jgi:hypothetical protein